MPDSKAALRRYESKFDNFLVQIGDLESSNAELEDSNTRLEGSAAAAQQRIQELEQQLQEARAKVGLCNGANVQPVHWQLRGQAAGTTSAVERDVRQCVQTPASS